MEKPVTNVIKNFSNDKNLVLCTDLDDDDALRGYNRNICCDPGGRIHRYIVFIFICFLGFGAFFCFDNPAALEQPIERTFNINNAQYGILYSIYSWPNIILPLFGGYLTDRLLGIRWGAIIFALLVAAGQLVFAISGYVDLFWIAILGRFIFAIGAENSSMAHRVYTVKWFKGKELNAAFGITLSLARMGNSANQLAMLPMYNSFAARYSEEYSPKALGDALFCGFLICLIAVGCGITLWWFDRRRDRYLDAVSACEKEKSSTKVPLQSSEQVHIRLKDILQLPLTFWLICTICMLYYCVINPFVSFSQLFYVNKFGMTPYEGNICNGIIFFAAIPGSLVSGIIVDYFGRNVLFIIISTTVTLFCHCLFAFTFVSPYIISVILGCSFSLLASSLWPSIAYVVPKRSWATAYGLEQCTENVGLAILFMVAGVIVDNRGYLVLEIFFILLACLTLGFAVILYFVDNGKQGYLVMSGKQRRKELPYEEQK